MSKLSLKKHKTLGVAFHAETNLVYDQDSKKVVGRIVDGKVQNLDKEAIKLCEEHKFKYDESKVEEDSDESEDEKEDKADSEEDEKEDKADSEEEDPSVSKVEKASSPVLEKGASELESAFNTIRALLAKGGDTSELQKKILTLQAENEELKKKNEKLNKMIKSVIELP